MPSKNKDVSRAYKLRHEYGLSMDQYQQLLDKQGGCCAICKKVQTIKRLCVDHDHFSGKVRGLLCIPCNNAIGLLGDTASGCKAAVDYLIPVVDVWDAAI